ncbi:MAG: 1,4-dihydroxy-2-naphthoate octaprenyltransferase [Chitinophagaceae bacterium]|nr:1,4-dihydroxy-2-naphthoate octaprenyltransferase [Chitinophagaceae bacterium]
MVKKATLIHLRIPFSFFLMPFFIFGISQLADITWWKISVAFIVVHFFHNGASNAFNSYFDKDEGSIGGIENPPPVDKELYFVSLIFDVLAVALGYLVNPYFAIMVFIIGLASKAYSHPMIRFKKYAVLGLLIVAFFQGFWTYYMVIVAQYGFTSSIFSQQNLFAGCICSLMLLGSYPMTQIYQHEEDAKRGDYTFSLLLGIKGSFVWTMSIFSVASILFIGYFVTYDSWLVAALFILLTSPVVIYFLNWMRKTWLDETKANYKSTMRLNLLSAICFNLFFVGLIILKCL